MTFVRAISLAALSLIATSAASGCQPKPTLEEPTIGHRNERKGGLVPAKDGVVENVHYLGCDVRFENLPEGTEIRIEWRLKGEVTKDWKTSQRETVQGSGNGTLHADLATDAKLIDPGTWECNFHAFVKGGGETGPVDVSAKVQVKRDPTEDE
ncbi:MAG: hypothetical protein ABI175_29960 [Polyangiales bacterium]